MEKFLLVNFLWSHTPLFGHILWSVRSKMWPKNGVWDHKKFDSMNFSSVKQLANWSRSKYLHRVPLIFWNSNCKVCMNEHKIFFRYKQNFWGHLTIQAFWLIRQKLQILIYFYIDTQCAEGILNKIAKPLNETFTGLFCMLQGFRICFIWNPRLKGIGSTC